MAKPLTCPECGGPCAPRESGFAACVRCGKLVIPPKAESEAEAPVATAPDLVIPDSIEAATGYRAWEVKLHRAPGELPLLKSVTYGDYWWTPRVAMEAECYRHHKDGLPSATCQCGLYAAKDREHLMTMSYARYSNGSIRVIGEVALWGKVVEGSQGWRAERGYPRKLFVPYEQWSLAQPLSETYGVPVELDNWLHPGSRK